MSLRPLRRPLVALGGGAVLVLLLAGPASAHVDPNPSEIPEGEATTVALGIEHGCDDSPTTSVAVQLPDGAEVTAVAKDGWAIDSSDGVVTWTAQAGNELPSDQPDEFELELTPDAGTEGDTLLLKTVQTCETGELRWIEAWDGEGEEPEHPAPAVTVIAAGVEAGGSDHHAEETPTTEAGHDEETGHHAEETATTEASHHEEETAADTSSSGDEDDSAPVAIIVLLLAAVGFGGVMLVRSRRSDG